jgi:5'-deoxynucleotidase YfbR-like HD superfamily hydrolase
MQLQQLLLDFRAIERQLHIPPGTDTFENDAEHSFALAMTAWYLAPHFPKLDRDLLIRYALAHDLVEVHAGDTYAYSDEATLAEKRKREAKAVAQLDRDWPDWPDMVKTIHTYEKRADEESKFIYALDKVIPALVDYLNEGRGWRNRGITFAMFVEEKNKKVPLSPSINEYCQQLITILDTKQHLFAKP